MKTKHLIFAVIAILVLTLLGTTTVKAQNGPSDEYAFIFIENMEDWYEIYTEGTIHNDAVEGVTYDLATNTLTLNNVSMPKMVLEANKMGDDFKLKLVGENSLAMLTIWGDNYGGSLTITGDGVLNIDTNGLKEQMNEDDEVNAISLFAENDNAILTVENTATVNIIAQSNAIIVIDTPNGNANNVIVLKNGQTVPATKSAHIWREYEEVNFIELTSYGDWNPQYTLYEKDGKMYGMSHEYDQYEINAKPIIYIPQLDEYIMDYTAEIEDDQWSYFFSSEEEIAAAGYTATTTEVTITNNIYTGIATLSQDAQGNNYVHWTHYINDNLDEEEVYSLSDYEVTLSDGKSYRVLTRNYDVDATTLEDVYHDITTENFDYYVSSKTLNIAAGEAVKPEETKPVENVTVKVEAAEETAEDTAATTEVAKLINSVVALEEGTVEGIDEELAKKIREKVQNGETIFIEVVSEDVKSEDVKEDATKVEEKISGSNKKVVAYFDIDVLVKTASESLGNVTNLQDKITLTVTIPEGLPAVPAGYTRTYKIIRVHNGLAEELETTVSGDKVSFKSDKFSTYALTYEDTKNTKNPATGDNISIYIALFAIAIIGTVVTVKMYRNK